MYIQNLPFVMITTNIVGPDPFELHKRKVEFVITTSLGTHRDNLSVVFGDDVESTEREAYRSLLSFLSAFAESYGYPESENRDLFPEWMAEWAYQYSDEIGMAEFTDRNVDWLSENLLTPNPSETEVWFLKGQN